MRRARRAARASGLADLPACRARRRLPRAPALLELRSGARAAAEPRAGWIAGLGCAPTPGRWCMGHGRSGECAGCSLAVEASSGAPARPLSVNTRRLVRAGCGSGDAGGPGFSNWRRPAAGRGGGRAAAVRAGWAGAVRLRSGVGGAAAWALELALPAAPRRCASAAAATTAAGRARGLLAWWEGRPPSQPVERGAGPGRAGPRPGCHPAPGGPSLSISDGLNMGICARTGWSPRGCSTSAGRAPPASSGRPGATLRVPPPGAGCRRPLGLASCCGGHRLATTRQTAHCSCGCSRRRSDLAGPRPASTHPSRAGSVACVAAHRSATCQPADARAPWLGVGAPRGRRGRGALAGRSGGRRAARAVAPCQTEHPARPAARPTSHAAPTHSLRRFPRAQSAHGGGGRALGAPTGGGRARGRRPRAPARPGGEPDLR
jgi:hypothetical protein